MNSKLSDARPPELLKPLSNRLARALMSPDQQELADMLRLTGLLGRYTPPPLRDNVIAAGDYEKAEKVGIWERQTENGRSHFVRSLSAIDDWVLWANVPRIEAKDAKLRVVLIGESVARGYLYEPEFTPALALTMIFEARFGKDQVEVIDLARTDLGLALLRELALSAIALKPDAVIIFSGNNWRCPVCPEEVKAEVHEALCQGGFAGMKRVGMEWLSQKVRGIVREVSSAYRARKIPLIWIVPEFNLGDWRIPPTNAPHLPQGGNREWLALLDGANEALAQGELKRAAELARKAADLDQGTSVLPWQILADCSLRRNDLAAARSHLESARDAVHWYLAWSISPGIISLTQQILREEAERNGDLIVDSPRLFAEHLDGRIPDRQLFLDYCHLTVEGIRLTMAAAASQVLRAIKGVDWAWQELAPAVISPSAKVDGEAAFLAAVHNAHWWQSSELVRHYCFKSVQLAPYITGIMLAFLEIQTRRAPMLMCAVARKIAESPSSLLRRYLLQNNRQQLDQVLLDSILAALKTTGINAQQKLNRLRQEEHSFMGAQVDLLDEYYYSSSLPLQESLGLKIRRRVTTAWTDNPDSDHYKAYWRESRFAFVGEHGCPAQLHFTCRLPHLTEGSVQLAINGRCEAELRCGRNWTAWEIGVPGKHVVDGVNEVTVHWPMPEFPGAQAFPTIVADLTDQLFPEFLCLFGEIESLRVCRPLLSPGLMEARPEESAAGVQLTARPVLRRRTGIPVASPQ